MRPEESPERSIDAAMAAVGLTPLRAEEHPSYPVLRRIRTLLRETMKEARPTQVPAIAEALRIANDYLARSEK
ncbi:MAG: hypothetical protein E6R04_04645 [Spirochaetes bacterium]|nr:MAG: hypothetical protein E6R04_04645 [Spirochaetota bacterium]